MKAANNDPPRTFRTGQVCLRPNSRAVYAEVPLRALYITFRPCAAACGNGPPGETARQNRQHRIEADAKNELVDAVPRTAERDLKAGLRKKTSCQKLATAISAYSLWLNWELSGKVKLDVRPQQQFAIEPTARTAIVGDTVVLACRVTDKAGALQWTKDGFGLGTNRNLSGFPRYQMVGSDDEGDYSLHISPVALEDDAMYQCQVGAYDGVKGIRSRTARFTVYVPNEVAILSGRKGGETVSRPLTMGARGDALLLKNSRPSFVVDVGGGARLRLMESPEHPERKSDLTESVRPSSPASASPFPGRGPLFPEPVRVTSLSSLGRRVSPSVSTSSGALPTTRPNGRKAPSFAHHSLVLLSVMPSRLAKADCPPSCSLRAATPEGTSHRQPRTPNSSPLVRRILSRTPPEPPKILRGASLVLRASESVSLTCESLDGKPAAELTWLDAENNVVREASFSLRSFCTVAWSVFQQRSRYPPAGKTALSFGICKYDDQVLLRPLPFSRTPFGPITTSPGLEYKKSPSKDNKRENAELTWTFEATKELNNQRLTCRAENPALKQPLFTSITVQVQYAPEISLTADKAEIREQDTVRFHCKTSAYPPPVSINWYRNDEPIKVDDNQDVFELVRVSRKDNSNTISCEARNAVGVNRSTVALNVIYEPQFKTSDKPVMAQLGTEVAISCDVDSNPKPEVVWTRQGSDVVLGRQQVYVIREMTSLDIGTYTCRATVPGFPDITNDYHVYIKGAPRVISAPLQYASEGARARIECLVQAVPPATRVEWFKGGMLIDTDKIQGYHIAREPLPSGERNLLVIERTTANDFGEYNCTVHNAFGEHSATISVERDRRAATTLLMFGATAAAIFIVLFAITMTVCLRKKPPPQ
ncbi:irregular chiasm C-roughest protein-like, partial [Tropilaelaps mercedesae]